MLSFGRNRKQEYVSNRKRDSGGDYGCRDDCGIGRNHSIGNHGSSDSSRDHSGSARAISRTDDCGTANSDREYSHGAASRSGGKFPSTVSIRDYGSGEQTIWSGSGGD